jgi:hypothetical protein
MAVPGRIARVDMKAIEVGGVTDHVNILLSLTLNHPTPSLSPLSLGFSRAMC